MNMRASRMHNWFWRRGSVFLYSIWVVMLLSLFAAGVGSQALFALDLSDRLTEQLRASYVARAAVQYAALALEQDPTPSIDGFTELWADNPTLFNQHQVAGGWFSVTAPLQESQPIRHGLTDEERRLNLNTAPAEVLARLLEQVGGLSEGEAIDAGAAIEDWRDEDDTQRASGAEDFYYGSLSNAYDCKDAPFEHVEELLLVRGISPEVYRRLEPYVTVYGSGLVNLNTASPEVVRALGISDEGVSGFMAFRSGEDAQEQTGDDRQLAGVVGLEGELQAFVPKEDLAVLVALVKDQLLTSRSKTFRFRIDAEHGTPKSHVQAMCVMDRDGVVQSWMER